VNLNNVDFNKLAVFTKIVEAGNYRLAAEALNVTPSALSQTISTLESSLGFPLFHRVGRRLVLTTAGDKIQQEFNAYHRDFIEKLFRIANRENQVTGLIRIGAYLEFAKLRLAPVLMSFQKKYPDVQVKLVFDTPSRLHRLLETNKLDLCFSIYPEHDSRSILSRPIYNQELVLVAPPKMLKEKPSFSEIMAVPMVEYYFNHQPIRRWLSLHYNKKPKQLPIRTFAATAEMVFALIQQGLGIGVVPEYLLHSQNKNVALTVCRPTGKKLNDHIWILRLKNRSESKALRAFSDEIENFF